METLEFQEYVREPYVVEAVLITDENIEQLAPLIGTLRVKGNGKKYIEVNNDLVKNIFQVHPGYYMTRYQGRVRCYSENAFRRTFSEMTPDRKNAVDILLQRAS